MGFIPWQATVQDDAGNAVSVPVVTVLNADDDTPASLFDIDGVALPSHIINGDTNGFVQFQVNPGRYKIDGVKSGSATETWIWDATTGTSYETRAGLVAAVGAGVSWPDGTIVSDGTVQYKAAHGSTDISDLNGLLPFGRVSPDHYGAVGDGVADDTASLSAAFSSGLTEFVAGESKTYRVTGRIEITSAMSIYGRLNVDIDTDYGPDALFIARVLNADSISVNVKAGHVCREPIVNRDGTPVIGEVIVTSEDQQTGYY